MRILHRWRGATGAARATAFAGLAAAGAATALPPVTLTELPNPGAGTGLYGATDIADDGTVIGHANGEAVHWPPGGGYERTGGAQMLDPYEYGLIPLAYPRMPVVSRDGAATLIAHVEWLSPQEAVTRPFAWTADGGWQLLDGITDPVAIPLGISDDAAAATGFGGSDYDARVPWVWRADTGLQALAFLPGATRGYGMDVSLDGNVVIGALDAEPDSTSPARYGAVRWVDGVPAWIADTEDAVLGPAMACNADCSVVVGGGRGPGDDPFLPAGRAWRWTEDAGLTLLGDIAGMQPPYVAVDASEDGRVIVGLFERPVFFGTVTQAFIWTESGGMEPVIDFLSRHGIDAFDGFEDYLFAPAISADGRALVLTMMHPLEGPSAYVVHIGIDRVFADGFETAAPGGEEVR